MGTGTGAPVPPSLWWPDLTVAPWPPPHPPPLSDHLTNSVTNFVKMDNIAHTQVELSMEEIPCLSAHSSEVSIILYPPSMPTYDSPSLHGLPTILPTVRDDPRCLTQVDD
jgi:hypothetical protein